MSDNSNRQQERGAAPMADQGLPPSGQQFERKKQYRARGCRGGAYRKGRTQRSASYNMRRDQERGGRNLDASAHQENDPHRLNRHSTSSYHHNHYHRNYRHHHHHRNQYYHGRPHNHSNVSKKESNDHSHKAKSRTLSILPSGSGEEFHSEGEITPCDVTVTATTDKKDPSPELLLAPILPSKSSDSDATSSTAESTVVPRSAVIAPISKAAKQTGDATISKQAASNFSFFALSPSSFLTGKKNGRSYF